MYRAGSEIRRQRQPQAARLDRVEVRVVLAFGRLALQARGVVVVVVDVAALAVDEVEHIERALQVLVDLVANAQVDERRGFRALAVVFESAGAGQSSAAGIDRTRA